MAQQASTRIEDLPDNVDKDISSKILKELNEDAESISSEIIVNPAKKSDNDSDDYISKILEVLKNQKETIIVFAVVFILSNKTFLDLISKVKYISGLQIHSLSYNAVISIIASVIFFVLKFILDKALK